MSIYEFYPHSMVTVADGSIGSTYQEEELPLNRPLFIVPAQSGEPHVPRWYPTQLVAEQELGPETFNEANAKYFSPAIDLLKDVFKSNGAFIARAVGADALPALSLICMAVKVDQDIPQWEIDPITGNYKKVTVNTTITTSAAVALNATSVTVTALTKAIAAGTNLNFGTASAPKMVNVTAQANVGATSLTIAASAVAITSGAVATMVTIEKVAIMDGGSQLVKKGATVRYLALNDLVTIAEALDHTYVATTDSGKLKEVLAILTSSDSPTANVISGTVEAVIVPVLLVMAKSPGAYGNDLGFTIDYDKNSNSSSAVSKRKGFIYDFEPMKKVYGTNNVTAIKSRYGIDLFQSAMVDECIDSSTKVKYDMRSVITSSYPKETHNLKMDFFPIQANINFLAAALAPYEESIPDLDFKFYETDGTPVAVLDNEALQLALDTYQNAGMLNLFGLRDLNGAIYSRIIPQETNEEPGFFNVGTARYLSLGADGTIFNKANFKQYFTDYLDLQIYDAIEDSARFPFTHLTDVGYCPENKYDMLDFMAVRQDIKVDVGVFVHPRYDEDITADGVKTIIEDISFGEALVSRAMITRECIEKGTNTCRASVFVISGYKPKQKYPVGLQNWAAIRRAQYHNKTFIDKQIEEFPNNEVDIFERYVWIPSTTTLKSLAWNTRLNYCQHYDMKRIHCPALRTVYDNDTSVLSDFNFADAIVYAKHEVRKSWAKLGGSTQPANILQPRIKTDVDNRLGKLLNSKYRFFSKPYQTDADNQLGFVQRVQIEIWSGGTFRLGIFEIICNREGLNT